MITSAGLSQRRGARSSLTGGTTAGNFTMAGVPIISASASPLSARISVGLSMVIGEVWDLLLYGRTGSAGSPQSGAYQFDKPRNGKRLV